MCWKKTPTCLGRGTLVNYTGMWAVKTWDGSCCWRHKVPIIFQNSVPDHRAGIYVPGRLFVAYENQY